MAAKIHFAQGDITDASVEAIVNAANTDLQLGAGVAGAIRRKGGPSIQEECDRIGPIPLGEAAATTAGQLKAHYVIHAAGMHLGGRVTADSLRLATRRSLARAEEKKIKSIAFPAIGTGVGGFPPGQCAEIMIQQVLEHLASGSALEEARFILFDSATLKIFEEAYRRLAARPANLETGNR
jgi:O-acetyl-ADP-ribose deacetylase (regulator of RNase III)